MVEISSMYGRMSLAPSAQLRPMVSGLACRTEFQNASGVWPESVRPEASVIVPEIITGISRPSFSQSWSIANSAAFAFSVSKIVSTRKRSTPPSASADAASVYVATRSSKEVLRKPGSLTSGEIDAVRLVGPTAPATKRGRDGSAFSNLSHAALASLAASRFSSLTRLSMW
jgi:hypothetical protein